MPSYTAFTRSTIRQALGHNEAMTSSDQLPFAREIQQRLCLMQGRQAPSIVWPEGCYGSAGSWIVFVGPSPGGGSRNATPRDRVTDAETPLWNTDFLEPVSRWSNGFRASMQPLLECATGLPLLDGAAKLYAFVNFHWQQNPDAQNVREEGMRAGADDVVNVLSSIHPRLIVPMEMRTHNLLHEALTQCGYRTREPLEQDVAIQISAKGRFHRRMCTYSVDGSGPLSGSLVVKAPQHPARMFNRDYAFRCGAAIRSCAEQLFNRVDCISIDERV